MTSAAIMPRRHGRPGFVADDAHLTGPASKRRFVSLPEAAVMLDVSLQTVHRWSATGYLPIVRAGQRGIRAGLAERAVVVKLARERRRALDWLNWTEPPAAIVAALAKCSTMAPGETLDTDPALFNNADPELFDVAAVPP